MSPSGEKPSAYYSAELVSRNPKWHFFRIVGTLVGVPYQRLLPYEAVDVDPTPRFRLLIKDNASGKILSEKRLSGASVANEAVENVEKDLEQLSVREFREKYRIRER